MHGKIGRIGKYIFGGLMLLFAFTVFCNWYIVGYSKPYILAENDLVMGTEPTSGAQTVIVLGAAVYSDGRLSDATQGRVESAVVLLEKDLVPNILVTGDNATREYNEVRAMKNALVTQGVSKDQIFQDFAGFDTYDSLYRAKHIFQVEKALVTTQSFHLTRAIFLARSLGINAYGVEASGYNPAWYDTMMRREYFARVKAWIEITFGSSPKFEGEAIPIDGASNGWVG